MWYRAFSPDAFLGAIVTLFGIRVISAIFSPKKNKNTIIASPPVTIEATYGREKADRCMNRLNAAVRCHNDCTMEVIIFLVADPAKAKLSKSMLPGDSIDFDIKKGKIRIYKNHTFLASTLLPEKSHLTSPELKFTPDAIVVTHDWTFSTSSKDFLTVAFFYKIDGVPPTKVKVSEN